MKKKKKNTLEFTAAFIITTKVYRDAMTTVAHAHSGTWRNTPAKAERSDKKTLENVRRPKWTDVQQQASLPLLWFLAGLKPDPWLYTEGLVTAFWTEYDLPFTKALLTALMVTVKKKK